MATLAFEDSELWTYADRESALRAGSSMLAALDPETRLKVEASEEALQTNYALVIGEMRRAGSARHVEKRAALTRLVDAMWQASQQPQAEWASALRSGIKEMLPQCYEVVKDWPEPELEMFVWLADYEPVKGERRPALEAALTRRKHAARGEVTAGDSSALKWEQLMGFATAIGVVRKQDGKPFESSESFSKAFGVAWRRLRDQSTASREQT